MAPLVMLRTRLFVTHAPEMQLLLSPQERPSATLTFCSLQVGGFVAQLRVPLWHGFVLGTQLPPLVHAAQVPAAQKL
jgi:hypothetical protein